MRVQSCDGACGRGTTDINGKLSRACACDYQCILFNDCCHDFITSCPKQYLDWTQSPLRRLASSSSECLYDYTVISGCPKGEIKQDDGIISRESIDSHDKHPSFLSETVVTDLMNGISYINTSIYKCNNNGSHSSLKHWHKEYSNKIGLFYKEMMQDYFNGKISRSEFKDSPPEELRVRLCAPSFKKSYIHCRHKCGYIEDTLDNACKYHSYPVEVTNIVEDISGRRRTGRRLLGIDETSTENAKNYSHNNSCWVSLTKSTGKHVNQFRMFLDVVTKSFHFEETGITSYNWNHARCLPSTEQYQCNNLSFSCSGHAIYFGQRKKCMQSKEVLFEIFILNERKSHVNFHLSSYLKSILTYTKSSNNYKYCLKKDKECVLSLYLENPKMLGESTVDISNFVKQSLQTTKTHWYNFTICSSHDIIRGSGDILHPSHFPNCETTVNLRLESSSETLLMLKALYITACLLVVTI